MAESREKYQIIKTELLAIRREISDLIKQCDPPSRVEELEGAVKSILGNAERVVTHGDDGMSPLLPWIVQRCKGVLHE